MIREIDLRPGKQNPAQQGVPGGEYPFWVTLKDSHTAYVSSIRDREVDVVDLIATPAVQMRIKVSGNPNKMILSPDTRYLYVAEDNSDRIDQIDTRTNQIARSVQTTTPSEFEVFLVNRASSNAFRAPPALPRRQVTRIFQVTSSSARGRMTTPGKERGLAKAGNIKTAFSLAINSKVCARLCAVP